MNQKKNGRKKRQQHLVDESEIREIVRNLRLSSREKATRTTFALRLNQLLDDREVNQNELAKLLNISGGAVSHYRRGQTEPSVSVIARLSEILGVSADYLLGLSEVQSSSLEDISISKLLGLSDSAIRALRMFKIESESAIPSAPRLKAINYLLEQEREIPLNGPASASDIKRFEEVVESWDESHPRLLRDILDYLLIKPNPKNIHKITYEGIKESLDPNFNLLNILGVKQTTFDDEIIDAIYTKRITRGLKKLKINFDKDLKSDQIQ